MAKIKMNIDYVSKFKWCISASIIMMLTFGTLFFTKGLNYGVDFRGGAEIQVRFSQDVTMEAVRDSLQGTSVPVSSVQSIGDGSREYLLKVQTEQGDLNKVATEIEQRLDTTFGGEKVEILKNDIVGPKAGAQLRTSGFQAIVWSLLAIMLYLSLRFDYKYAPGAIAALIHDVLFIVGAFILTQKEFSLQTVAALLAIIGYSVNDTVVIYDRVRELEAAMPNSPMNQVVNRAVNETMSRTILTASTVFIVCLVMWLMGGGVIQDFFFALTIGTVAGAYSTVFIASPITIAFDRLQKKGQAAPKAA
jgi:preprotein translocase subunit SecF